MIKKAQASIMYDFDKDKFLNFRLAAPLSLCWQINTACNLKCKYCLSKSGPEGNKGMSTKNALRVIRELGALKVMRLDFTGGEPLLREDLETLLKEANKQKINTLVTTNTLLLDDKKIEFLKKYASLIQVSIDGPEETHNKQRGADVYKTMVNNIKRLKEAGCKVRINSFIFKDNLKHIDYLLELSKNLGIYSHLFILFTPQGRGKEHQNQIIPKEKIEKLKQKLIKYRDKTGFYVRMYDYREYAHSCVLLEPDGGGYFRSNDLSKETGMVFTVPQKIRKEDGSVTYSGIEQDLNGKNIIVTEDIIASGSTLSSLAKEVKSKGAKNFIAFCTHCMDVEKAVLNIKNSDIDQLFVFDTTQAISSQDKLTVLPTYTLLAEFLKKTFL